MNTLRTFEQYTPSDEGSSSQSNDPFQHHRLIAGYHQHKEQGLAAFSADARKNPDPRVQKLADNYEKRRVEQAEKAANHLELARKYHREDIHGNFDECIPPTETCLAYFKTI